MHSAVCHCISHFFVGFLVSRYFLCFRSKSQYVAVPHNISGYFAPFRINSKSFVSLLFLCSPYFPRVFPSILQCFAAFLHYFAASHNIMYSSPCFVVFPDLAQYLVVCRIISQPFVVFSSTALCFAAFRSSANYFAVFHIIFALFRRDSRYFVVLCTLHTVPLRFAAVCIISHNFGSLLFVSIYSYCIATAMHTTTLLLL